MQFIPARGRKPSRYSYGTTIDYCNLSPRGDGNDYTRFVRRRNRIAIYPREGTETQSRWDPPFPSRIAIYPREGTETNIFGSLLDVFPLQFIPARGRKPWYRGRFLLVSAIAIYPREGTETSGALNITSQGLLQFIPARGRKLEFPHRSPHRKTIAIYPREGTETNI